MITKRPKPILYSLSSFPQNREEPSRERKFSTRANRNGLIIGLVLLEGLSTIKPEGLEVSCRYSKKGTYRELLHRRDHKNLQDSDKLTPKKTPLCWLAESSGVAGIKR